MQDSDLAAILVVPNGARFVLADLHVHSYGASRDVQDPKMTAQAIVDSAHAKKVKLLALTDHHSVQNVRAAQERALLYPGELLVIPGVEISTSHGHLLAYFADVDTATKFIARVNVVDISATSDGHVSASMADVITEVERLGGICVAAHIDRAKTGFETREGYATWKRDILVHPGLFGIEVDDSANLKYYSADDSGNDGSERRKLFFQRRDRGVRPDLARVQNSDAHELARFASADRLTRIKVDELSYDAVVTAFKDPLARIRSVAALPDSYPTITGVAFDGGFLDGEVMHFSRNLNTIFGGRGTGKSTVLRSIAYALDRDDEIAARSDCPDCVTVFAQGQGGLEYRITRDRGYPPQAVIVTAQEESVVNVDSFPLEYYCQNALSKVSEDLSTDTRRLQEFLDQHCLLLDLRDRESRLEGTIGELAAQLVPIELEIAKLPAMLENLEKVDARLKAAEAGNLKTVAAAQQRLSNEVRFFDTIKRAISEAPRLLRLRAARIDYDALAAEAGPLLEVPSSETARSEVRASLEIYNRTIDELEVKAVAAQRELREAVDATSQALAPRHASLRARITERIASLQQQGLKGDLRDLDEQLRTRAKLADTMLSIRAQRTRLEELKRDHGRLLAELSAVRTEITKRRKDQLEPINRSLARTIEDFLVVFLYNTFDTGRYASFLMEAMHGSFFPDVAGDRLTQVVEPDELARLIRSRDEKELRELLIAANVDPKWIGSMLDQFDPIKLYRLEAIWRAPLATVKILTRTEPRRPIDPATLSDGQRHTILLTVAMLSQSSIPLIIDQPEDDLDNAFISSTVVGVLREVKERRQVLVVTHNANIAVLGDSEMMFPMKRDGERGRSFDSGSIDRKVTRDAVQAILEGGRAAFIRRGEMYGVL